MTSIIGYTRVPFNPSCSIAPVQRLYQARPPLTRTDHKDHVVCNDESTHKSQPTNTTTTTTTTFHRMFSRESSVSNGIIELIGDTTTRTSTLESSKIAIVTKPAAVHKDNSKSPQQTSQKTTIQSNLNKNYNTYLSIELNSPRDYQQLPTLTTIHNANHHPDPAASSKSDDNLQRLMDAIARLAYDTSVKFLNIIELLKQLQTYQDQHRFMSCIDKQKQLILVYFPNTLSTQVHQTQQWLKTHAGIDIERYHNWHLVQDVVSPPSAPPPQEKDFFDGPKYFDDIHMFINQVDALIESNGLFSQAEKKKESTTRKTDAVVV